MPVFRSFLAVFLLFGFLNVAAVDEGQPTERVKYALTGVGSALQDTEATLGERWDRIRAVIEEVFDFHSMSASILTTGWTKATPEEQEQFVEYFTEYLEHMYREKIEAYDEQEISFTDERIIGNRAIVDTVIHAGNTNIPVNYALRKRDGQWYGYDIVIEGLSLVSNFRGSFASMLDNHGMDGLLADLREKNATFSELPEPIQPPTLEQ